MAEVTEEQLLVRKTVIALSDDDLLAMVTSPPEEYTPYALEVARQEITRRGGQDAVQQHIAQETLSDRSDRATAGVESRSWKKIIYGILLCLGGIVLAATALKTFGQATRYIIVFAIVLVAILFGLQLLRDLIYAFWLRPRGTYIDPSDPLWQNAARQARESVPILRGLAREYLDDIMVKVPFVTDSGERELVWGRLREITDSAVRATIETVPLAHAGKLPDETNTPLSELLDWHLELPDGTIRGSFTTQAESILRERGGLPLPRHIAVMKGKFVDRFKQGPVSR